MSKTVKILIFVLTILPIVLFMGGYIAMVAGMMGTMLPIISSAAEAGKHVNPNVMPEPMMGAVLAYFICIALAMLIWLGMLIFYIANLVVTNRVPTELRPVWGVLFFVGAWISWIVYWYMYIWREPTPAVEVTTAMRPPSEPQAEPHHE